MQIGFIAQAGLFFLIVGLYCLFCPYKIAKWYANDVTVQRRLHRRAQGHKKKKYRTEYRPSQEVVEPTTGAVRAVRILGVIAAAFGVFLIVYSFI